MLKISYIRPPRDQEETQKVLETLLPMIEEYWKDFGDDVCPDTPLNFDAMTFAMLLLQGTLALLFAHEEDTPVGFLFGVRTRPLLCSARTIRVEHWWGRDSAVTDALFEYLDRNATPMEVDEIVTRQPLRQYAGRLAFKDAHAVTYRRLVR